MRKSRRRSAPGLMARGAYLATFSAAWDPSCPRDTATYANRWLTSFSLARSVSTCSAEKDLGRGLREHRLGIVAVTRFELAPALESEHDRIVRLPVFGDGSVQLWQSLQAREFVEHEPHGSTPWLATIH